MWVALWLGGGCHVAAAARAAGAHAPAQSLPWYKPEVVLEVLEIITPNHDVPSPNPKPSARPCRRGGGPGGAGAARGAPAAPAARGALLRRAGARARAAGGAALLAPRHGGRACYKCAGCRGGCRRGRPGACLVRLSWLPHDRAHVAAAARFQVFALLFSAGFCGVVWASCLARRESGRSPHADSRRSYQQYLQLRLQLPPEQRLPRNIKRVFWCFAHSQHAACYCAVLCREKKITHMPENGFCLTCRRCARRRGPGECFELRARRGARGAAGPLDAAGPANPDPKASETPRAAPCVPGRPVLRGALLALSRTTAGGPLRQGVDQPAFAPPQAAHGPARKAAGAALEPGRAAVTAGRAGAAAGGDAPAAMDVDAAGPADPTANGGAPAPAPAQGGTANATGGNGELVGCAEGLAARGGTRAAGASGGGPEEALADAWREDANAGRVLRGVQEVFGDALLPYAPAPAIAGLFL